jgi:AcrR family transcriptional regulator
MPVPRPVTTSRRADPEDTRRQLLEAGLRLLATDPAATAFGMLKASSVAAQASRTTGAFFHHWPTQDDYILDLIDYAFRAEQSTSLSAVAAALEESVRAGEARAETLLTVCRTALESLTTEPQTAIQFLMWKRSSSDPDFAAWMHERYEALDAAGAPLFEQILALTGRKIRPPFSVESAGALMIALAQGLLVRHVVEENTYPRDILGWILIQLLPLITAAPEDDRDAAAAIDDLATKTLGAS